MKLKKEQKKQGDRLLLALFFLLLVGILIFVSLIKTANFSLFNPGAISPRDFGKLVSPLPPEDSLQELTNKLTEKNIPVDFPLLSTNSAILVHLSEGGEIFFSPNKDLTEQINSLQLILSRLKIEGKQVKKIDLRFDQPIVVY